MTKVAVVIPTYNRKPLLKALLLQLKAQNKLDDIELYIVVIVDGSNDGTYEMLNEDFHGISVVKGNGSWWYTKCMNEGFKEAEKFNPEFILTLNDDVTLADNYLIQLKKLISMIDDKTIVNSISLTQTKPHKVINGGVKKYISWRGKCIRYFPPFAEVPDDQLKGLYPTWIISGRGILIPNKILQDLNYFDEGFPQYGSDDDFGLRAIKAGYKVLMSRDLKIFENTKLTSKGVAFNQDGVAVFIKSFFNKYSINSLQKATRFALKHTDPILLPINIIIYILGTSYAYFFKYKKIVTKKMDSR